MAIYKESLRDFGTRARLNLITSEHPITLADGFSPSRRNVVILEPTVDSQSGHPIYRAMVPNGGQTELVTTVSTTPIAIRITDSTVRIKGPELLGQNDSKGSTQVTARQTETNFDVLDPLLPGSLLRDGEDYHPYGDPHVSVHRLAPGEKIQP